MELRRISCQRTSSLESSLFVEALADVEWLIDQFTCIEMKEVEILGGKRYHRYTHPEGEPDDALHTFCYALIADAVGRISPTFAVQDLY